MIIASTIERRKIMDEIYMTDIVDSLKQYDGHIERHGIQGMHWGIRRFQNHDGSLTALGYRHVGIKSPGLYKGLNALRKSVGSSRDFIKSKSSKLSSTKTDILDKLNRKGLLNILDSKANAEFKATQTGQGEAARRQAIIDNYKGKGTDALDFITNQQKNSLRS